MSMGSGSSVFRMVDLLILPNNHKKGNTHYIAHIHIAWLYPSTAGTRLPHRDRSKVSVSDLLTLICVETIHISLVQADYYRLPHSLPPHQLAGFSK